MARFDAHSKALVLHNTIGSRLTHCGLRTNPTTTKNSEKIKTEKLSESLATPSVVPPSPYGQKRFRSLVEHLWNARAAAADYIIYFKQLTVCQSDKTNFCSKIRKFH